MGNYAQIDLPSQLILGNANLRMSALLDDLANGTINTQPLLQAQAAQIYNAFFTNLGTPLVTPMNFVGMPYAEDWNSYQQLLAADLTILYGQTSQIATAAINAINMATIQTQFVVKAANQLIAAVAALAPSRPTTLGNQSWTVTDNFTTTLNIDTVNSRSITMLPNVIELGRAGVVDQTPNITLAIDDTYVYAALGSTATGSSNGFVGRHTK